MSTANLITALRIVQTLVLLGLEPLSTGFIVIYLGAGISDMLDGAVARWTHTESSFGARFDTAADLLLVAVCLIRLLPIVMLPVWLWAWIAGIALLRLGGIAVGLVRDHRLPSVHSTLNRVTGLLLFLLPLTLSIIPVRIGGAVVCASATAATLHELWRIGTHRA